MWSATTGVISAVRGYNPTELQTTAAVNPGCSGGPVLDARGRIVGITVAYTPSMKDVYWAISAADVINSIGPVSELHLIDIPFTPQPGGG
jgi:S1-C subfamily serine protease